MQKIGRNDPCPCGSGKKFKACCWKKNQPAGKKSFTAKNLTGKALSIGKTFSSALSPKPKEEPKDENS